LYVCIIKKPLEVSVLFFQGSYENLYGTPGSKVFQKINHSS